MLGDMERTQLKDSKALNFERKGHELTCLLIPFILSCQLIPLFSGYTLNPT